MNEVRHYAEAHGWCWSVNKGRLLVVGPCGSRVSVYMDTLLVDSAMLLPYDRCRRDKWCRSRDYLESCHATLTCFLADRILIIRARPTPLPPSPATIRLILPR